MIIVNILYRIPGIQSEAMRRNVLVALTYLFVLLYGIAQLGASIGYFLG